MRQIITREEMSSLVVTSPRLVAFLSGGFTAFTPSERTRSTIVAISVGLSVVAGLGSVGKMMPSSAKASDSFTAFDIPQRNLTPEPYSNLANDITGALDLDALRRSTNEPSFMAQDAEKTSPQTSLGTPFIQAPMQPMLSSNSLPFITPLVQTVQNASQHFKNTVIRIRDAVPDTIMRAAIHAGNITGMDPLFLLCVASTESGMNTSAKNKHSSAQGPFQFTNVAWLEAVYRFGSDHGMDWLAQRITQQPSGAMVVDHAAREHLLTLRDNPAMSAMMAAAVMKNDCAAVEKATGNKCTLGHMYLIHLLGTSGAVHFVEAAVSGRGTSSDIVAPTAVAQNRNLFTREGKVLSAQDAMKGIESMMADKYRFYAELLGNGPAESTPQEVAYAPIGHRS